jgi:hypothetical protein
MIIRRWKNKETVLKFYTIMTATQLLYVYENLTLLQQPEKRTETAEINFFVSAVYTLYDHKMKEEIR